MVVVCVMALVFVPFPQLLESQQAREASTGFDNQTNGLVTQEVFEADMEVFDERESEEEGLGPVYNAQACSECHQNPVIGAGSQVNELRAGRFNGVRFLEHPGGSLINDRAIDPSIQETILAGYDVRTFRASLNTLGDGYVEAIADQTLINISRNQPSGMKGEIVMVPVLEANNTLRVGRFGWKNQHASLVSFSADAYLNEMGITSPLQPTENSSMGRSVAEFDSVADPEDSGDDIVIFARFMRATKAPPRDEALANTQAALAGSLTFNLIGCNICHVRTIVTAPAGTPINGGAFTVPAALGGKTIHPFSDFLLHNVGTGDGIVQNGGDSTRNKLRTPPLWGVRTRPRLMHDGQSLTLLDAIQRHGGEARDVINLFRVLPNPVKQSLLVFLSSL
jgi:CxxC motif-containing protein (DUF1111 family)